MQTIEDIIIMVDLFTKPSPYPEDVIRDMEKSIDTTNRVHELSVKVDIMERNEDDGSIWLESSMNFDDGISDVDSFMEYMFDKSLSHEVFHVGRQYVFGISEMEPLKGVTLMLRKSTGNATNITPDVIECATGILRENHC